MKVIGVDFTSAPSLRKPITAAHGHLHGNCFSLEKVELLSSFSEFEEFLRRPGPWIAGFDFPFGLPRESVIQFGWPTTWESLVVHCSLLGKSEFASYLNKDRESRPFGNRYRYRKGDRLAGSSPAVRLHQVPVGYMFFEGAPRLAASGVSIPFLRENEVDRIAVEAYPGYLTKTQLKITGYKNDEPKKQTAQQKDRRRAIVSHICKGDPLGIRLEAGKALLNSLVEDPMADRLDSVLCGLQAAWSWTRRTRDYGLPKDLDCLEGWIVTVGHKE